MQAKTRAGIPMSETELQEWKQAFVDIEESIEMIDEEAYPNPEFRKYMQMKQQELF